MAKEFKKIKADDGREEEIEIDKGELKDEATLKRWDGECYIKIGRKEKDTKTKIDGSVFKFDVELKKKPKSNVISFDIETKNLKFYYQPELTQEKIDKGCYQPENVIGSYAVYHATIGNMHSSKERAEKYKCGKAFHIYRPKIIDANDNWVWGELNISNGSLTITIPQDFLDNAVYPVMVDPDFGYKTEGGMSMTNIANWICSSAPVSSGGLGTADYVKVHTKRAGGVDCNAKCALYKSSDKTLKGSTEELVISNDAPSIWKTFNITGGGTIENTDYYIAIWGDVNVYISYDALGDARSFDVETYGTWPDPADFSTTGDCTYSIYCSYTEGGASTAGAMSTNSGYWGPPL